MPRQIRLNDVVRPDQRVPPEDLGQVRWALSRLGVFDPARTPSGEESLMGGGLRRALGAFQAGQGLREDSVLQPRGPTEQRLNLLLERERSVRVPDAPGAIDEVRQTSRKRTTGALAGRVGPGLENHPEDVTAVGEALRQLGHIKPAAPRPAKTGAVFGGLKNFQRATGLKRDSIIAPDGPTEQLMLGQFAGSGQGALAVVPADLNRVSPPDRFPAGSLDVMAGLGGSQPLVPTSFQSVGFEPASDPETLARQAGNDVLLGEDTGDRLLEPPVTTSDGDERFAFRPVRTPEEIFDDVHSGSRPPAAQSVSSDPFPAERFEMLNRSTEEIAEIVNVRPELIEEAGPDALQALRGVASSLAHDEKDRQALDDLLTGLEDAGHGKLVERLQKQREMVRVETPLFDRLWPSDWLRERTENDEITAVGLGGASGALSMLGSRALSALGGAATLGTSLTLLHTLSRRRELERRERFREDRAKP